MNKNILLVAINAKYIHSNLAVYSLSTYARHKDIKVTIAEYTINQQPDSILADIYSQKPDVLCLSCYIWNIRFIRELTTEFHKICPDIPIWLGGPEVSYDTEQFLTKNAQITGIIIGEGEESFYRLCRAYTNCSCTDSDVTKDLTNIDGIAWRNQDNTIHTNEKNTLLSMDDLPFAYEDLTKFENRIIYYESSRGCPFSCSYCLSSVDKCLRLRSLNLVYPELQFFLDNNVPQVKFVDRTFNCDHNHSLGIWKYIKEHDNGITNFHFEISADLLNDEEIELLRSMRPGLVQLEIGVQTTNPVTLKEIRRYMSLEKITDSFKQIQKMGNIHQHLDLIAGLPFEDYTSFINSFDEIYKLKSNQLQLGFLKVLKGSYMHTMANEYALTYRDTPPYEVLSTKWISYEELLKIKSVEEMLEIHYNSGQFLTALNVLENCFNSPFEMYLKLAEYYNKKGYTNPSYTRVTRTEIFYDFALTIDKVHADIYRDALMHDLYIRERSKKRPGFAFDYRASQQEATVLLKENNYDHRYCHIEPYHYNVWEIDYTGYGTNNPSTGESYIQYLAETAWMIYDYKEHTTLLI